MNYCAHVKSYLPPLTHAQCIVIYFFFIYLKRNFGLCLVKVAGKLCGSVSFNILNVCVCVFICVCECSVMVVHVYFLYFSRKMLLFPFFFVAVNIKRNEVCMCVCECEEISSKSNKNVIERVNFLHIASDKK
jgi:hypothetical protein